MKRDLTACQRVCGFLSASEEFIYELIDGRGPTMSSPLLGTDFFKGEVSNPLPEESGPSMAREGICYLKSAKRGLRNEGCVQLAQKIE